MAVACAWKKSEWIDVHSPAHLTPDSGRENRFTDFSTSFSSRLSPVFIQRWRANDSLLLFCVLEQKLGGSVAYHTEKRRYVVAEDT